MSTPEWAGPGGAGRKWAGREETGREEAAPEWAAPALAAMLGRVAAVRAEVGERFPLFADPADGRWTTTRRGSWTGGFWAGLLWLRARHTGEASDRQAAAACTARLADWVDTDTAARGLILWYGTVLADDEAARRLRDRAAHACLKAFDPELGLVPWGSAFGGPRLVARPDAVPGMVPLLAVADAEAAESHLWTHLELCRGNGAMRHDPSTGWVAHPDPTPGWSRGRAWLLLAVAEAAGRLDAAELRDLTGELTHPLPVPPADDADPDGPLDTSAAAITAVALLELGRRQEAVAVLEELVRVHLAEDGGLREGCYDRVQGVAVRNELVWGDYFLAVGLAELTGLVTR
ncbi:sugar ABC transporter permease [Streptomyces sp. NBC_00829]|uniref:sugar ABC transporter permease n=1 Tax=Streptomyces sp. NBC_00829 TaxID=2903679 RepID=UPI00387060E7